MPSQPNGGPADRPAPKHPPATLPGAEDTVGSDESYLQDRLSIWERAEPGKRPQPEVICAQRPDLLPEFVRQVRELEAANAALQVTLAPTTKTAPAAVRDRAGKPAGTVIGPYKLLQRIGEGGFGSVFLAEQQQPIQRRVALKIIKLGMDTRMVIARFEAERQALALMDHPNIARVLDAGATPAGRPYFVMELVKGEPITNYADTNRLSIPERITLFAQVCQAVQHAHQKGIIHRDLKPSNVLVSTQDGKPFAKVIDFGVAKATASRLTEKTLFTEHRQMIGTPQYMSPEQAEGSADLDTRTDVYSLGVLLYELLTGSTPFDPASLRSAAYDEMRRIIREVEPPKPSTRLSQATATLPAVATKRRSEPAKLNGLVRGELDWIVMKALEKERARRYASANDLAADLHRHLAGEAVVAAPPTAGYRLRKLASRYKAALATTAGIFLLLAAGILTSTWLALRARRAEQTVGRNLSEVVEANRRAEANAARAAKGEDEAKRNAARAAKGEADAQENARKAAFESYVAHLAAADASIRGRNYAAAASHLAACDRQFRGWEWRYLNRLRDDSTKRFYFAEKPGGKAIWFDGFVGVPGEPLVYATDGYSLYALDLALGRIVWKFGADRLATEQGLRVEQAGRGDLGRPEGVMLTADRTRILVYFKVFGYITEDKRFPAELLFQLRDARTGEARSGVIRSSSQDPISSTSVDVQTRHILTLGERGDGEHRSRVDVWDLTAPKNPVASFNKDGLDRIDGAAFVGNGSRIVLLAKAVPAPRDSKSSSPPANKVDASERAEPEATQVLRLFEVNSGKLLREVKLPSDSCGVLGVDVGGLAVEGTRAVVALKQSPVVVDLETGTVRPLLGQGELWLRSSWASPIVAHVRQSFAFRQGGHGAPDYLGGPTVFVLSLERSDDESKIVQAVQSAGWPREDVLFTDKPGRRLFMFDRDGDLTAAPLDGGPSARFRGVGPRVVGLHAAGGPGSGNVFVLEDSGQFMVFGPRPPVSVNVGSDTVGFDRRGRYWTVTTYGAANGPGGERPATKLVGRDPNAPADSPTVEWEAGPGNLVDGGWNGLPSVDRRSTSDPLHSRFGYVEKGSLYLLDLERGARRTIVVGRPDAEPGRIGKAVFSPDGKWVCVPTLPSLLSVYDANSGRLLRDTTLWAGRDVIINLAWTAGGLIAQPGTFGGSGPQIQVIDPLTGEVLRQLPQTQHSDADWFPSPSGRYLAARDYHRIYVLDMLDQASESRPLFKATAEASVVGIAWSADEQRLFIADGQLLRVVDFPRGRELLDVPTEGYTAPVRISPDGLTVIAGETLLRGVEDDPSATVAGIAPENAEVPIKAAAPGPPSTAAAESEPAARLAEALRDLRDEYASGNWDSDTNRYVVDLATDGGWDPKQATPAERLLMTKAARFTLKSPDPEHPDHARRAKAILARIDALDPSAAIRPASTAPTATKGGLQKHAGSGGDPKSLYERLGGDPAITAIVNDFVVKAAGDPKLNFTRKGHPNHWDATSDNVAKLEKHLVQFIEANTGGPLKYEGRDMGPVHEGMEISEAEWGAILGDLKAALNQFTVPDHEQSELIAIVATTHDSIIHGDAYKPITASTATQRAPRDETVTIDEHGWRHTGYFDERHAWHGGYRDDHGDFHQDPANRKDP
jgi:serine/threonine protein kinase/truncated hemoglobin YjbI/outer membrane protein assembly factor BamB